MLDCGCSLNEVARHIGCHASSVMRWRDARRAGGAEALQVRRSPGRPLKLNSAQRQRLLDLLLESPEARGFPARIWKTAHIAELVQREFGVHYHPDHIGRLMRRIRLPGLAQPEIRV